MKKLKIIASALVAVFALSAMLAATASAETLTFLLAEILVGGEVQGSAGVAAETTGEIELEDVGGGTKIQCSGIFNGKLLGIADPSHFLIEKLLNLAGEEVTTAKPLLCKAIKGCTEPIKVVPINFPWLIEYELDSLDGKFWALISGDTATLHPGYTVKCLVFGIEITDTCTAAEVSEGEALNVGSGIEGKAEKLSPNGNCSIGGTNSAVNTPVAGNTTISGSGSLSLSSGA